LRDLLRQQKIPAVYIKICAQVHAVNGHIHNILECTPLLLLSRESTGINDMLPAFLSARKTLSNNIYKKIIPRGRI